MSDDSPVLVREEETGAFGLYHPDENVIETYIGDDREEIAGEYYGHNWHDAEEGELTASIEVDIEGVRDVIEELREQPLAEEQERVLDQYESRLESHENVLDLVQEVLEDAE